MVGIKHTEDCEKPLSVTKLLLDDFIRDAERLQIFIFVFVAATDIDNSLMNQFSQLLTWRWSRTEYNIRNSILFGTPNLLCTHLDHEIISANGLFVGG